MEDKLKGQGLSMEALMGQLGDSNEFNDLKQKVSKIEKSKTKVSAALPKTQRDKLERKVAYEEAKGTISLWSGIVSKNRQQEFIRFEDAEPDRFRITDNELTAKFVPTTDMEKEIDVILEKSEMKEKSVKDKESRDLELNKLSIEDVKQRNSELAKMKSLLFYQEQKNKRINKIKSKKYHKIHKRAEERRKEKERELIKQTDPALYKELLEKDAIKRAKERMSLKHKNTSKWIKRALQHGGMSNNETREAINEQLREGERLKRRQKGLDDDESSDISDDENVSKETLMNEANSLLHDIEQDNQEHKGVFQMEFMKRAIQKQKEEAKLEAEKLIHALQEEQEMDDEFHEDESEESEEKEETPVADDEQAQSIREALSSGSVKRSKKQNKVLEVTDAISIKQPMFAAPETTSMFDETPAVGSLVDDILEESEEESEEEEPNEEPEEVDDAEETGNAEGDEDEDLLKDDAPTGENPWLTAAIDNVSHNSSRKEKEVEEELDVNATMARLDVKASQKRDRKDKEEVKVNIIDETTVEKPKKKGPILGTLGFDDELDQEELMNRAFADAGAEEDFAEDKARVIAEDEQDYKKKHKIQDVFDMEGWGNWAGIGAPEPKKRKPKIEKEEPVIQRTDAKLKHVIINQNVKQNENVKIEGVPFPFTSREQYERAMRQPLGKEWNSKKSFGMLTQPEIKTRRGVIIDPIKMPQNKKQHRKF